MKRWSRDNKLRITLRQVKMLRLMRKLRLMRMLRLRRILRVEKNKTPKIKKKMVKKREQMSMLEKMRRRKPIFQNIIPVKAEAKHTSRGFSSQGGK